MRQELNDVWAVLHKTSFPVWEETTSVLGLDHGAALKALQERERSSVFFYLDLSTAEAPREPAANNSTHFAELRWLRKTASYRNEATYWLDRIEDRLERGRPFLVELPAEPGEDFAALQEDPRVFATTSGIAKPEARGAHGLPHRWFPDRRGLSNSRELLTAYADTGWLPMLEREAEDLFEDVFAANRNRRGSRKDGDDEDDEDDESDAEPPQAALRRQTPSQQP